MFWRNVRVPTAHFFYSQDGGIIFLQYTELPQMLATDKRLKKRRAIYVLSKIDMRSCNHCFSGKQQVWHILSVFFSLRYPGCNAHAPYSHVWPARHYNIFPHYYINCNIFGKSCRTNICVLILSTTFVSDVSHFMKNWARYDHEFVMVCT